MKTSARRMCTSALAAVMATAGMLQIASAADEETAEATAVTKYRYVARFDNRISGRLIAFNLIWECGGHRCHSRATTLVPLVPACEDVVRVSGNTVKAFFVAKENSRLRLTREEIRKCNA